MYSNATMLQNFVSRDINMKNYIAEQELEELLHMLKNIEMLRDEESRCLKKAALYIDDQVRFMDIKHVIPSANNTLDAIYKVEKVIMTYEVLKSISITYNREIIEIVGKIVCIYSGMTYDEVLKIFQCIDRQMYKKNAQDILYILIKNDDMA